MITITRRGGSQQTMRAVGLLATVFLLFQPGTVRAQSNVTTNGGTIGKIPKWTAPSALGDSVITELSGNVGIGTTNPQAKAHIYGTSGDIGLRIESGPGATRLDLYSTTGGVSDRNWTFRPNLYVWGDLVLFQSAFSGGDPVAGNARFYIRNDGNIGIGTTTPGAKLEVSGRILSSGTLAENSFLDRTSARQWTWYGTSDVARFWASGIGDMLFVTTSGSVGIGATPSTSNKLHVEGNARVTGNMTVDGNVAAKYQDVAEWVPASRAISAGTVVVLDTQQSNHVLPSDHAYDTRVAGVVSAKPGVLLGEGGEGKVMVATTGRVRVKVDATRAPIRVGDLLVTSDKEGIAMRSQPLDLGGTPIHRPGTLIGKALEPLEKGTGEILVLLSLQ